MANIKGYQYLTMSVNVIKVFSRVFKLMTLVRYTMTMTMTMISFFIVSSGFNIFNTFINLYDQRFILNNKKPYA